MLVVILLVVLFAVVFNCKPQPAQLLPGGTILNLTGNGILPLSQLAIADELSALVAAMDKDNVFPAFDTQNLMCLRGFGGWDCYSGDEVPSR